MEKEQLKFCSYNLRPLPNLNSSEKELVIALRTRNSDSGFISQIDSKSTNRSMCGTKLTEWDNRSIALLLTADKVNKQNN